jgi:hypothetical protein
MQDKALIMISIKSIYKLIIVITMTNWLSLQLSAQNEDIIPGTAPVLPVNGYIILSNGDTLYGKLRWALKYVENNPVEIKFFAENGATKSFNASEIKGFGNQVNLWMEENPVPISLQMEHYTSLPSYKKGVPVFLNRLIDGMITVYQNRSSGIHSSSKVVEKTRIDGIGFSFSPGEGLSIGPTYRTDYKIIYGRTRFSSYFISKNNAALVKIDRNNYEAIFSSLFDDCPSINEEIKKNPDLKMFKNFMILAEVYNQFRQDETGLK